MSVWDDFKEGAEVGFDMYGDFITTGDLYETMKDVKDTLEDK